MHAPPALKFASNKPIRPLTQVAATLIPQPPCRYLSHPPEPQSRIGAFFFEHGQICDSIHSIEITLVDNRNRDGDTPHPPNTQIAVSATLSPDMPSAGAFFCNIT